jgi:hypothetical protein
MNAKIINAFGRKVGDPLPGSEPVMDQPKVCARTIRILEEYLKMAQTGELHGIAIAGVAHGGPVQSVVVPDDADIRDFAVQTLAARMVYGQMLGMAFGATTTEVVEDPEDEE